MSEKRIVKKEEKVIRLLDYLKRYTDERNPASIPQIERHFASIGHPNFFGNKNTRKEIIKELVRAINTDIDGNLLPYEEWRIVYQDFTKENIYGTKLKSHHIVNIYYRQDFDADEIDMLSRCVKNDDCLQDEIKERLLHKIKECLTNENYGKKPKTPAERTAEIRKEKLFNRLLDIAIERKAGMWE